MARILKNGDWLSDEHIQLAQELLRKQFPHLDGLQSSLLCQNDGFIPIQSEGTMKFYKIMEFLLIASFLIVRRPNAPHQW